MMSAQERLAHEKPPERPLHAMDPRQLTDMFFSLTTAEREMAEKERRTVIEGASGGKKKSRGMEQSDEGEKKGDKPKKKWLDMRIDLNEFKRCVPTPPIPFSSKL